MATVLATPAAPLRRALGAWDLTWLFVVAIANLNIVPVIAAGGLVTIWLWLCALCFFFLPQGIAVIELSRRMPAEGGIYIWTKEMFGDFHGFMCGWVYWTTNMFYLPTLLFYLTGILTYTGVLAEKPYVFFLLTVGLLWLTAFANILGLGVGKWVNNAGGLGTLIGGTILIVLGGVAALRHGIRLPAIQKLDWPIVSSFGVICFGLVGLELGSIMGDEIRDPKRSVPRGVLFGGLLSGALYVGATLALLLGVPRQNVMVLQGVLQGVDNFGVHWIVPPLALLLAVSIAGSTSAWLSGSARILFVSGLDRYLPKAFGRVHPRHATPHVALIGMSALSSGLVVMSFLGQTTVKEAYVTLLDLAVVLQMMSYLYLYASLAKVAFTTNSGLFPKFAAISGLATTTIGMIVAFVPSRQVASVWRFELKMFITCAVFLGLAAGLFAYYSRRRIQI